ncbi:zinc finger protein 845-like isoform X2 [Anopheles coustani]|uniref:zinc finger protein 845-like isoform X2 n=1 Tax=Anopheles coustani TaxID=139045 RepID=UPI00265A3865|nr:zinc finger protein 845-like isoform X2 [Anopheles coustani]
MAEESEFKHIVNTRREADTSEDCLLSHNGFVDDINIEIVKFEPCDEHPLEDIRQQDHAASKVIVPSISTDEIEIGEVKIEPFDVYSDPNHISDNWRDTGIEESVVSSNNKPQCDSSYDVVPKALLHAERSSPSSFVEPSLAHGQVKIDSNDLVLHLSSKYSSPDPSSLAAQMTIQKGSAIIALDRQSLQDPLCVPEQTTIRKDSAIVPLTMPKQVEEATAMHAPIGHAYACNKCDKSFNSLELLSKHIRTHVQLWRCDICNKSLRSEYYLAKHKSKLHGCGSTILDEVAEGRARSVQLTMSRANINGHTNDECVASGKVILCKNTNIKVFLFRCENCNESFETKLSLEKHIESQHQSKQEETFHWYSKVNSKSIPIGEKSHASEQPNDCKQSCPISLLKQPVEIHAPDGPPFRCEKCAAYNNKNMNIFFRTKLSLEEHNTLHHAIDEHALDGPPFRCKICNKSYKHIITLKTHNALYHPLKGSEKSYTCIECDESFDNIVQLKNHRKYHIWISCPQCKKMVKSATLKAHLKHTHAPDDKRFRCDLCCKEYKNYGGLKWHITLKHEENEDTESQKKSYVCEQCNKAFHHKALWQQHRRSHIQQLCHICGKMMGITVIQMHIENHLVEPLGGFKCELCDRRYTQKCTLQQHIATMHRPANKKTQCFRCNKCEKSYTSRKQLLDHRRNHNFKKCSVCEKDVTVYTFKNHMRKHEVLVNL